MVASGDRPSPVSVTTSVGPGRAPPGRRTRRGSGDPVPSCAVFSGTTTLRLRLKLRKLFEKSLIKNFSVLLSQPPRVNHPKKPRLANRVSCTQCNLTRADRGFSCPIRSRIRYDTASSTHTGARRSGSCPACGRYSRPPWRGSPRSGPRSPAAWAAGSTPAPRWGWWWRRWTKR